MLFTDLLQLLVDFDLELFGFDFLEDLEIMYSTHGSLQGSLQLVGPFEGVGFFESVGVGVVSIESVGFGEIVGGGVLGGLVALIVGAGVRRSSGVGGWRFPPFGDVVGVRVVPSCRGESVGLGGSPIALLQNAGHALATGVESMLL